MNTNVVITLIVIVIVVVGGFFVFTTQKAEAPENGSLETSDMEDAMEGGTMSDDSGAMEGGETTGATSGSGDTGTMTSSSGSGMETGDSGSDGQMMEDGGTSDDPAVVTYTSDGFSPATVTIPAGGTVTFVNEGNRDTWPASAIHPTHTVYPGSSISKCDTAEEDMIFDACGGVPTGGSYSFTFTEAGEWKYHDHLSPRNTGTIIVQ